MKRKPYPSDVTDQQWALIEPLLPRVRRRRQPGRPREVDLREVVKPLPEQQGEDRPLRVRGPLPELGPAADAPRANVFMFFDVHWSEVLAHRKRRKWRIKRRAGTQRRDSGPEALFARCLLYGFLPAGDVIGPLFQRDGVRIIDVLCPLSDQFFGEPKKMRCLGDEPCIGDILGIIPDHFANGRPVP